MKRKTAILIKSILCKILQHKKRGKIFIINQNGVDKRTSIIYCCRCDLVLSYQETDINQIRKGKTYAKKR